MSRAPQHRATPIRHPRIARTASRAAAATAAAVVGAVLAVQPAQAYEEVWDAVAQCESSGDWAINTGNGFYGGLQFTYSTWRAFGGQTYAAYAHQASKAEQIAIARRTLYTQGPGAWPVCSVRAGLTKTTGAADPNAMPGEEAAPPVTVTRYVSATTAANVRSGPGTSYAIVGSRTRGTEVSGTLSGSWLKIGDSQHISTSVLSTDPIGGISTTTRYVSASVAANVRSGPGTGYGVVGTIARGTKVTGALSSSGWLKIGDGRWLGPSVLSVNPV